jgi:hypothetical protein
VLTESEPASETVCVTKHILIRRTSFVGFLNSVAMLCYTSFLTESQAVLMSGTSRLRSRSGKYPPATFGCLQKGREINHPFILLNTGQLKNKVTLSHVYNEATRIQNAFCCGVAILQHGLPWRRRPETLSRVNYKQTLIVFPTIVSMAWL